MTMSIRVREMLIKVCGGDNRVLPLIHQMCHLPYRRKAEVFQRMIKDGITGKHLYEVAERNAFSPFRVYKAMIDRIDGDMKGPMTVKELIQ